MRMPRMTTRKWMAAVAALAVTFGGYREVTRLKRVRDQFLVRAAMHIDVETYYRRLVSSSGSSAVRNRIVVQESADRELMSPAPTIALLDRNVEIGFGLAEGHSTQAEEDDHNRFRQAQARGDAVAERCRMIMDAYYQRQMEYHQRQAEYHAALGRKYMAAAAHPWFSVAPDAPKPK
jgi:hypothetical protein